MGLVDTHSRDLLWSAVDRISVCNTSNPAQAETRLAQDTLPQLSPPNLASIDDADLSRANIALAALAIPEHISTIPEGAHATESLARAEEGARTPAAGAKAEHYREIIKSVFELAGALTGIGLALFAAVATAGAASPLLVFSSIALLSAATNTAFAVINIARANEGKNSIKADAFLQGKLVDLARKLGASDSSWVVTTLKDKTAFSKMMGSLELAVSICEITTNLTFMFNIDPVIDLTIRLLPFVVKLIGKSIDIYFPTDDENTDSTEKAPSDAIVPFVGHEAAAPTEDMDTTVPFVGHEAAAPTEGTDTTVPNAGGIAGPAVSPGANNAPTLSSPTRSTSMAADLINANAALTKKVTEADIPSTASLHANASVAQATESATTQTAKIKAEHYNAMATSIVSLAGSLIVMGLALFATITTGGAAAPLLIFSSIALLSAVMNTAFADINIVLAKAGKEAMNSDAFLRDQLVEGLKMMGASDTSWVIRKLNDDAFYSRMIGSMKLAIVISEIATNLTLNLAIAPAIALAMKLVPTVASLTGQAIDIYFLNDDEETDAQVDMLDATTKRITSWAFLRENEKETA